MAERPLLKNVSSAEAAPPVSILPNRTAIYLMTAFVLIVMVAWISFLGWGAVALLGWIVDLVRSGVLNPAD